MTKPSPFTWFKTRPEIIRLAVMLHVCFPLSLRNVEDLLHERRIENVRSSRWRWHLDEMFVQVNGKRPSLWRAVDHEGEVLESFVTRTRDKKAALKFLRKATRKHGQPEMIATDRLRSCGAALGEIGAGARQETGRSANNRAENSHLPFRRCERAML